MAEFNFPHLPIKSIHADPQKYFKGNNTAD